MPSKAKSDVPAKVYIVGQGPGILPYAKMFYDRGNTHLFRPYIGVRTIEEADIVVFTGGPDVDPSFYGEKPLPQTFFDPDRDAIDIQAFCDGYDKLKVGICRGGQFLNVMSGGKLWQHVVGHTTSHPIRETSTGRMFYASSTHHQMMRPAEGARIIATGFHASRKDSESEFWELSDGVSPVDVEVCWYEETKSLCFQPHPEHKTFNDLTNFFFNQLALYRTLVDMKKAS